MAAVVILRWMVIGYVGFRTAICRGHELNIADREALKGTSWDQYYEEIQEGIEWINRQEAEDIFIRVDGRAEIRSIGVQGTHQKADGHACK